jgi:hypothetical protein
MLSKNVVARNPSTITQPEKTAICRWPIHTYKKSTEIVAELAGSV